MTCNISIASQIVSFYLPVYALFNLICDRWAASMITFTVIETLTGNIISAVVKLRALISVFLYCS